MSEAYPLVSVIIPAYNCEKTIGLCIEAVFEQDYPGEIQLIVVNDGSTDSTESIIHSRSKVKLITQDNAGPAAARNAGAAKASGEFILFTDSDCIPEANWVSRIMENLLKEGVNVVAGSYGIANPHKWLADCVYQEIRFRHETLMSDEIQVFGGYNFGIRKEIFEKVGGFEAKYAQASGEDNDLSYKIINAGHQITFDREARVKHYHPEHIWRYLKEQFRHGFWRVRMYADHPQQMKGDGYTFWKDMIEPVLVGMHGLILIAGLVVGLNFINYMLWLSTIFLLFEIIFAGRILKNFSKSVFFGWVMWLRSFARTFGLSTGISFFSLRLLGLKKGMKNT